MLSFTQSFIYKAALIFAAIYVIYLLVFKDKGKNKIIYLLIITFLTFLIKLPYFFIGELNPDEGEWMTIVKIWNADFNPYINNDPHTTGIIGLMPLYLFDKLIPLHYSTIRIVGTLFDLITIFLTYRILLPHLKQNKKLLFIALAVLYCMLNISNEKDFIAYNTEHLCILVFTLLVYILQKMGILFKVVEQNETTQQRLFLLLLAGLLMGSSLFIKLQNIPAIFILFCFTFYHFLKNKKYKDLVLLILFCLLPAFFILSALYLNGSINDFYTRYILTNLDYSGRGLNYAFIDPQLYEPSRFKIQSIYPFLIVLCLVFLLIITNTEKVKKAIFNQNFLFFLIILLIAIIEVRQPKTYLQHYYLLLYQPLIPLFICLKNFELRKNIFLSILAFQFLYFWVFKLKDKSTLLYAAGEQDLYTKITSDIKSKAELNNCDDKNILVWGWNSRYYVYGRFLPVTRDFVNVHLFIHEDFLERYYLHSFISDVQRNNNKKILVIDDLQRQKRFKLYKFPEFIDHYNLSKHFNKLTMVEHNDQYDTYVMELF